VREESGLRVTIDRLRAALEELGALPLEQFLVLLLWDGVLR
jgi:hypothetical protein